MKLTGQSALITGGASGLGLATAKRLASQGVTVHLLDMNEETGLKAASDLGGYFYKTDVTSEEQVSNSLSQIKQNDQTPRIIVNCAGIVIGAKTVGRDNAPHPLESFKSVIDVNLIGSFNVTRLASAEIAALDMIEDNQRGVIINTASIAAMDGQIGQVAYAASKAAIAGMTLPIARDLASLGIRCCTIAPGIFMTPMMSSLPEEVQDSLAARCLARFPPVCRQPPAPTPRFQQKGCCQSLQGLWGSQSPSTSTGPTVHPQHGH